MQNIAAMVANTIDVIICENKMPDWYYCLQIIQHNVFANMS